MPQSLVFAFVMTHVLHCVVMSKKCVYCERSWIFHSWWGPNGYLQCFGRRTNLVLRKFQHWVKATKIIFAEPVFLYRTNLSIYTLSILITASQGDVSHDLRFTDQETEAQSWESLAPYHTVREWQKRDLKLGPLGPQSPSRSFYKITALTFSYLGHSCSEKLLLLQF